MSADTTGLLGYVVEIAHMLVSLVFDGSGINRVPGIFFRESREGPVARNLLKMRCSMIAARTVEVAVVAP